MAISSDVQRKLLARSGGRCGNPNCRRDLFPDVHPSKIAGVVEMAHIIAQSEKGARGAGELPESERDEYENIILLCPNCHTVIDKMKLEDLYDEELIKEWKRQHEERIREAVEVPRVDSREELVTRVRDLMRENRAWWEHYGPDSPAARDDPLSEAPRLWLREVRRVLIPNNWEIIHLVERNRDHLTEEELDVTAKFKVHAEAFATKHLTGEADPYAPQFPVEMDEIFSS
jgi:hypothetical protein